MKVLGEFKTLHKDYLRVATEDGIVKISAGPIYSALYYLHTELGDITAGTRRYYPVNIMAGPSSHRRQDWLEFAVVLPMAAVQELRL